MGAHALARDAAGGVGGDHEVALFLLHSLRMARRVTITKLQRRTAAAVESIALCQTITADGRLADDEIAAFKQWLTDNKHVDLPAKDFLALTVTKI